MASQSDEYVKITISNEGILDTDGNIDKGMLGKWDSHLDRIKKGVQSATNYNAYINNLYKKIDHALGRAEESLFIRASELENVQATINRINNEIFGEEDERRYTVSTEKAKMFKFSSTRAGRISQSLAEEVVTDKLGGTFGFATPKDKANEKITVGLFATESEISSMGGEKEAKKQMAKNLREELLMSTKYSNLELKNRKEAEEAKRIKEREKELDEEAKAGTRRAKTLLKSMAEKEEEVDSSTENKKEKSSPNKVKLLGKTFAIYTILVTIADITRRILTSVLTRASKEEQTAVTAHSLGMSYGQVRELGYSDMAHGLPADTTLKAIQSFQQKFGDTTKIDEASLTILARVMGEQVADLVRSGMGGKEPDKLFEMTIDKFFENFMHGKNSLGQSVGKEQARRELTTVLSEVSPDLALVFSRMADEYMYGINKDKFNNYAGFRGLTTTYYSGLLGSDFARFRELGQAVDQVTGKFENLKDNILVKLSDPLLKFISWADKLEIGKSAEEKVTDRYEARKRLAQEEEKFQGSLSSQAESMGIPYSEIGFKDEDDFVENIYKASTSKFSRGKYNKFMDWARKHNQVSNALMLMAYASMRAKAIEGQSTYAPVYSSLDWSEGAVIKEAREISSNSSLDPYYIGSKSSNEMIDKTYLDMYDAFLGRFKNKKLNLMQIYKQDKIGKGEQIDITMLRYALNKLTGVKNKADSSDIRLGFGLIEDKTEYQDLQNRLASYIDSEGEAGIIALMKLWKQSSNSKAVDTYSASALNKFYQNLEFDFYANLASRWVEQEKGKRADAYTAEVKDGKLNIILWQGDTKTGRLSKVGSVPYDYTGKDMTMEMPKAFAQAEE